MASEYSILTDSDLPRDGLATAHRVSAGGAVSAQSAISREFGKSVNWLLTGKTYIEPKKRVPKDDP
jgi:hypothetical protein